MKTQLETENDKLAVFIWSKLKIQSPEKGGENRREK